MRKFFRSRKRIVRRWLWLALLSSLFSWIFAGCAKEPSPSPAVTDKSTIIFWHSYISATQPALERLIQQFEAEHPEIDIQAQYVPTGDALLQKLTMAIMTNTAPDICWVHSNWVAPLSEGEHIYDLQELVDSYGGFGEEERADLFPVPLQTGYYKGRLRMMPIEATNLGFAYNKELFRQAGLDPNKPPKDWTEFIEYGKKLTIREGEKTTQWACSIPVLIGNSSGFTVWAWMAFLRGAGGHYAEPGGERVAFDSAAGQEALSFWVDLQHKHKIGSMQTPQQGFENQKIAMALTGPWDLPHFTAMPFDWGILPIPAGPKERATSLGVEYLVVFRQTTQPEAAWEFIRWFITPEVQEAWSKDSKYLPIRRSVLESPTYQAFLEENPALKVFAEQMPFAYAEPVYLPEASAVDLYLAGAIEQAVRGKQTPQAALAAAAEKANALIAANRKKQSAAD